MYQKPSVAEAVDVADFIRESGQTGTEAVRSAMSLIIKDHRDLEKARRVIQDMVP